MILGEKEMKKKIFLTLVMAVVFALTLVLMVSAESVHAGKVDLNATVTLNDSTVCNLFDSEGNALIWYKDANGTLQSIRADDERVKYKATYQFNVGNSTVGSVTAYEVSSMWIQLDESTKISNGNIVVLNLMDDDVLANEATNNAYLNKPVNCLKTIVWANKAIEYAFLRLDTVALQQQAFNGCSKLKYINLESLTELRQIGGEQTFGGCTSLFKGENKVLDLTGTKLVAISGTGAFNNVPVVGLKLPNTLTTLNDWNIQGTAITSFVFPIGVTRIAGSQFNDCKSLKEIYINKTTTKIAARAFNNTALEKVFFVGTLDELNALLDNTDLTSNAPLEAVIGENRANIISYADYQKLADKSGKYVVYNYSYCEAYNDGEHDIEGNNPCVGTCNVCQLSVVNHSANADVTVSYVYTSFAQNGQKITSCANDGCTYEVVEALDPLFTCTGFSASQTGTNGIVLGFKVNQEAIAKYTEETNNTIEYGIFAGAQKYLGTTDLSNEELSEKIVKAKVVQTAFTVFEVKMMGFTTDEQMNTMFAIGAYVAVKNDEGTTYSYMQLGTPSEGERYCYDTYNNIVSALN